MAVAQAQATSGIPSVGGGGIRSYAEGRKKVYEKIGRPNVAEKRFLRV